MSMYRRTSWCLTLIAVALLATNVDAQKGGSKSSSSGSRSSSSGSKSSSSSSKPSSGSSKSSSSSSKYSSPSSKASSGSSSKPPSTNTGSSSKYSAPSSKSSDSASSSKPASNSGVTSGSSSKYSAPSSNSSSSLLSSKPKSGGTTSDKAQANKEARSERKYVDSVKATAPPKSTYTTPTGSVASVRTDSKHVDYIRNQPSNRYTPEARRQTTVTHVTNYNYSHPYDYYHSQPSFYVGGGYSSAFWFMMSEWSAERRAMWLYNNQNHIDKEAYNRGVQDAQVAAELAKLKAANAKIDEDYVDPEFKDDPSIMYDDKYIEAAYNPTVIEHPPVVQRKSSFLYNAFIYCTIGCVIGAAVWFVFFKKWGYKDEDFA